MSKVKSWRMRTAPDQVYSPYTVVSISKYGNVHASVWMTPESALNVAMEYVAECSVVRVMIIRAGSSDLMLG